MQEGKVSGEVLTRFEAFRADFKKATAEALATLAALQGPSPTPLGQRAESALGVLQLLNAAPPLTITHDEVEPRKLPHRRSDTPRRKPERWPAITYKDPPTPQDLAPTVDAPLTSEIQALAAQHHFDPAALFAFVHDTIEFQPYFGSLKGAQGTLLEKAGNDMDQASLLIALLRASHIPARYVAGVVDLPIDKVMNWVGVETPQAALRVFAQNGIPVQARMDNEDAEDDDEVDDDDQTITHLRFFHVWVEAFLARDRDDDDDHNRARQHDRERHHSRGRHHRGDDREARRSQWVPLDPSFKQHEFTEGIDLTVATGFDLTTFLQGWTRGATINEAQSFFTHLNEPFIQQELTRLKENLRAFVRNELGPEATVGDVLGTKRIKPFNRGPHRNRRDDEHGRNGRGRGPTHSLDDAFPFETFTPQLEVAELPQGFRHLVNFAMFGFSHLFALPELAGKRVTVSYVAATQEDQHIIDDFGGILNVFPAFILNLKPQLKVEGQLIAEGQGVPLGSSQILRSAFLRPLGTAFDINDKIVTTGAFYAVILDLQKMPIESFQARLAKLRQSLASPSTPRDEIRLESINAAGVGYFAISDLLSDIQAAISKVRVTREPSVAVTSQDLLVFSIFGFPFVRIGGLSIDVTRNIFSVISVIGDPAAERAWFLASGAIGSAEEHGIFENLFNIPAVSTERLLQVANSRGVPIFAIDQTNLTEILPQLETFDIVKQRIVQEVNAGRVAIIPKTNLQFFDYFGIGFIVADLRTGAAGYLLAGFVVTGGGGTAQAVDIDTKTAQKEVLRGEKAGELAGGAFEFGGILVELGILAIGGGIIVGNGWIVLGGVVVTAAGVFLLVTGVETIRGPLEEHKRQIDKALGTP